MRAVPRESLLPADKAYLAYADAQPAYAPGRCLLSPRDIAKLLQAIRPRPGERALAIAAPYGAMVLTAMGLGVTRLDEGDLTKPAGAYDVVICEGGVCDVPDGWTAALAPDGRLGVVVRDGPIGRAKLFVRTAKGVGARDLFDCAAPVLPGFEAVAGFAF
jgi:protein-L-isoaspartate(D-aspartate) O-methyltransferase